MLHLEENKAFNRAVAFVCQTDRNLFLTGKAGTGKTTFLKYIKEHCHKNMAVLAPTGVAAINAGGVTIHSFFQIPFGMYLPDAVTEWGANEEYAPIFNKNRLFSKLKFNRNKLELIRELDTLIIDEVSMVRADLMDAVDDVLRAIRRAPEKPFGGLQMLFIGDLYQLPPVVKNSEAAQLANYYESPFFYASRAVKEAEPVVIELEKIYRQSDEKFISLLNKIRNNNCSDTDIAFLNGYYHPDFEPGPEEEYITLTSHNQIADRINQSELQKLSGKEYQFEAVVSGDFPEKNFPVEQILSLKVGAQIMFIKNDKGEARKFFNGKIGRIEKIDEDKAVWVRFRDETELFELPYERWQNIKYNYNRDKDTIEEEELGTFEQFPIRLAWAVTIHKSQGLTFDRAIIDAGRSFAPGQVYVALSRLRGLSGLALRSPIHQNSITTDAHVTQFLKESVSRAESQDELLQEDRKIFLNSSLLKAFQFEKLSEKTYEFIHSFDNKKMENKEEFIRRGRQILDQVIVLGKTAEKFGNQLAKILPQAEQNGYVQLSERTKAASEWFDNNLQKKVIPALSEMKSFAKTKGRTTALRKELSLLISEFERKRKLLQQILALVAGLAANKSLKEVIQEYADAQNIPGETILTPSDHPKKDTRQITLELYNAGRSIEEIAKERSLQQSTIETHLMQFLPSGEVPLSLFVKEEDALRLEKYFEAHPEVKTATEIRAAFNDEFTYTQIRATRLYFDAVKRKQLSGDGLLKK